MTAGSLLSPLWYRIASLRPRLRGHVRLHRHHYRGEAWFVVQDTVSGRHHRLRPAAYQTIALMDGERTMEEIWTAVNTRFGDEAPTQDEVIRLLGQLHGADALRCDVPPDTAELLERHEKQSRARWKSRLWTPLALRFPLVDPDVFLARLLPYVAPAFTRIGAVVWLAVVASAAVLAAMHWSELTHDVVDRALTPRNLLLLALVYPVVKVLHELGHGFATRMWGGEVHEMGITLLVLVPIPYVDASSAWAFRDKRRRMVVGAAGMAVELFLAALALFVWLNVESGVLSAIAYNVMLIGGVSSLFFNGNPLLQFDGYYILADAIEIPNLVQRSNRYLGYLAQRYLFGLDDARSPATTTGERRWLFSYGVLSFVYRVAILGVIIVFVAGRMFILGMLLALWATATQVVLPLVKHAVFLFANPKLQRRRLRAIASSGGLILAVLGVLFLVPAPLHTTAEGVVWLPERSHLRAGADCFVVRLLAEADALVGAGERLVECEDPFLDARVRVLEAQLAELDARYSAHSRTDRVQAEIIREQRSTVEADLTLTRERAQQLVLQSPHAGRFVVPRAQDWPGRFVKQGELIGFVVDVSRPAARAVVTQAEIALVRERTRGVEVRLAERIGEVIPAAIRVEVPAASGRLPSAALGTAGGGRFAVDPADAEGVQAFQTLFQLELELSPDGLVEHMGGRVYVRFDHGLEPLAFRWGRSLRRLLLSKFDV